MLIKYIDINLCLNIPQYNQKREVLSRRKYIGCINVKKEAQYCMGI